MITQAWKPFARSPAHGRKATRLGTSAPVTAAVTTKTTELGDSRVRVDVEVASAALEREMETAASAIGREMRVPGFRAGKVPSRVVIQQVGREAVLDEAVRRGLPAWYEEALTAAGITAVGDPKVDLSDLPEKGSPLAFTIEVGIVPPAKLGDYKGVEVAAANRASTRRRCRPSWSACARRSRPSRPWSARRPTATSW